jgi:RNA polymerase sigma-70 factor (ECF subfamily)
MTVYRDDPRAWDDEELVAAIARGDGESFSVLYRRHLSAVLAYLMRETRDPEAAADLVAEVFAEVLAAATRYEPRGASALPWLIGIARHKLLMSFRRGRVEARARRRLALEPVALEDADLERVESLAGAGTGRLAQMLAELPDQEEYAIRSHVVQDRSYREIASQLRTSELVVRKRVSRGLARLRDQLSETGVP